MKKSRYASEQVASGRRQAEEGIPMSEVCHQMGISEQTFPQFIGLVILPNFSASYFRCSKDLYASVACNKD